MDNIEEYTRHQRPFESLLRTKGYHGNFELISRQSGFHRLGSLHECLHRFIYNLAMEKIDRTDISLKTYAEFLSADDYKECEFIGIFDKATGFVINRLVIQSRYPDETKRLVLQNSNGIPGKNAIIGRFRRPKPWEQQMKGKFKFRHRR